MKEPAVELYEMQYISDKEELSQLSRETHKQSIGRPSDVLCPYCHVFMEERLSADGRVMYKTGKVGDRGYPMVICERIPKSHLALKCPVCDCAFFLPKRAASSAPGETTP